MAFQEVNDLNTDVTISLGGTNKKTGKANPTKIEGYYLGKKEVEDRKKKSGKSYIYVFQTPKGNVGVWGKTDMDRKMEAATEGFMLRVSHTGMAQTPNGEMYKYKVEFDSENTIPVLSKGSSNTAYEEPVEASFGTDDEDEEDNFSYEAPTAPALSASSAAERQAKVQALLNKKAK